MSQWTDERIALLSEMWASRMTETAIAKRLRTTRSAVSGKLYRLGLLGRGTRAKTRRGRGEIFYGAKLHAEIEGDDLSALERECGIVVGADS